MFYEQIKVKKDVKKCPQCQETLEWTGGKVDESEQQYSCLPCRVAIIICGFTKEDQEIIVDMAFEG